MTRTAPGTQQKYYKIGEVCELTDTQPYVLRFWESEFPQLAPRKNRSGQRVYERSDIDIVMRIKKLLYEEEYTIAGARRKLDEEAGSGAAAAPIAPPPAEPHAGPAARPTRQLVIDDQIDSEPVVSREPEHPMDDLAARAARPRLVAPSDPGSQREARLERALGELKGELRTLLSDLKRQS